MISEFLFSNATNAWLLRGDIVATIAVGVGIFLEAPKNPTLLQRIALWLVVVGVVAETLFSIGLFAYDESVSQAQQDKIIALDERLAARTLTSDDETTLANALSRFPAQEFEITSYREDAESWMFGEKLANVLVQRCHWVRRFEPADFGIAGVIAGVAVYTQWNAGPSTDGAATALVTTLNARNIGATHLGATQGLRQPLINITVGIKP
jgi:hypothetical protein